MKIVSIGEISEINPKLPVKEKPTCDTKVTFVPMAAVSDKTISITEYQQRAYEEVAKGFTSFKRDDIIIAKITPCFENGKMAHAKSLPTELGFGSTEFHVIRANSEASPAYLYHLLREPFVRRSGEMKMKGAAGQRRVPTEFFKELKIPLPPLDEQKRIAAILDAADELRAKRRQTLVELDTLIQSTFLDMFGDPVTNPKGWDKKPFKDSLENIDSGWSPKCLDRKAESNEWGVLKLGAVTKCLYNESEQKALPPHEAPRENIEVLKGDLLFSRKNTHDLVAACALVRHTRRKLMLPDLIFRLRFKASADLLPAFTWQLLVNPHQRKVIQKMAGGAAGSMPNISKAKLNTASLIRPPLDLQQQFADIVEKIGAQKSRCQAQLDELDTLFASLQSRAFKGEL